MMKRILLLTMALLALVVGRTMADVVINPDGNGIIYVKADGDGDGSNWEAAANLSDALKGAASGNEIWVAAETYMPKYKAAETNKDGGETTERYKAFVIPAGVHVYGGFAGTETQRDQRDWIGNETILSGDINNDNYDDCYHVVIIALTGEETATLDGFTITRGAAVESTKITVNTIEIQSRDGGGVYASGNARLIHNTIHNNYAGAGGWGAAVYAANGVTLEHNIIHDNSADGRAGGVYATGNVKLSYNKIYNNSVSMAGGAGVYVEEGTILKYNTIYGNYARGGSGGGVYANNATLIHNTIYENKYFKNDYNLGGGVYAKGNSILSNNIIWGNIDYSTTPQDLYIDGANTTSYNLIGAINGSEGYTTGEGNKIGEDPRFVSTAESSFSLALQTGSPAIGAGKDGVDMGAYLSKIYVKQNEENETGDGSSWADAKTELADALLAEGVKEIWVAKGTYLPKYKAAATAKKQVYDDELDETQYQDIEVTDRDKAFVIPAGVAVYGGFAGGEESLDARDPEENETILSGEIGDTDTTDDNCYHVVIAAGDMNTAVLDGFTVTGGNANGEWGEYIIVNEQEFDRNSGGGISIKGSNLTVNKNTIEDNHAQNGGGVYAFYSGEAAPIVLNLNTICNNTATSGGGVNADNTILTQNIIHDNTTAGDYGSDGGGVAIRGCTLNANIIYKNNTAGDGGGVFAGYSLDSEEKNIDCTLTNNVIYENDARKIGGGVYAGWTSLTNNTIYGNTADRSDGVHLYREACLTNNIIWENGNEGESLYVMDYPKALSHNLIDNYQINSAVNYTLDETTNLIGSAYAPGFTNAEEKDFSLLATSPAINKGGNAAYLSTYPTTDAAGNARVKGGTIDIGAYEYQSADENVAYHTISLTIAEGIHCDYLTGEYTIAESDHLFLSFFPEEASLTAADILFLIDGVETAFN
ncbi:right-handed parallel beta-helix repeat-containing protein, partial [Parabacteroides sp. PF5-6]|uniref:right-handed parallel beta-helix repeat-containing protein n=1 Tax=Parabacteroides sp. PF5-6 TaxID=1742403 RepID=UPI002406EAB2